MKTKNLFFALPALVVLAVRLAAQTITTQPTNQVVISGSNAVFSVAVSGAGPLTFQWQFNGTNLPFGIITTVAGNGGGELNYPSGVAVDASGNLFVADSGYGRICKVGTNGIINSVAGNGGYGYSGDGGAATNAELAYPTWENPTYSAFWSVFGVTCPRLRRYGSARRVHCRGHGPG